MDFVKQVWQSSGTVRVVACVLLAALVLAGSAGTTPSSADTSGNASGVSSVGDFFGGLWKRMPWVTPDPGPISDPVGTATDVVQDGVKTVQDGIDAVTP